MKKKVLWLIPARSGSKSIPDKNIRTLSGHPLLTYRIKSALNCSDESDVWISTDAERYAKIANEYGAHVPFLRPPELSEDETSSIDVVLHAMAYAQQNNHAYDYVGLLEPTSPFITTQHLDEAINMLDICENACGIIAVKENRPNSIFVQEQTVFLDKIAKNLATLRELGRQSFCKEITPSGGFYISKWNEFLRHKTFYTSKTLAYEVDELHSLEIDEPIDWLWAEFILEKKLLI